MQLHVFVALALVLVYVAQFWTDIRSALKLATTPWYTLPLVRSVVVFVALLVIPLLVVSFVGLGGFLDITPWLFAFSVFVAGLISYTWYRFLTWLDVFEPESKWTLALVAGLSMCITFFVPSAYQWVEGITSWNINGNFGNDLFYSFVVIGGLEELAKLIPYLLILLFTKRINEPYDHLLYLSVSALGFAFVENIMYLQRSGMSAVAGRALYASVAHMCFSSVIGYGVAVAIPRGRSIVILSGVLMFAVACLMHALYDVWLIGPGRPTFFTTVFFLGTIQLWVIMQNNLVNISPFVVPHRKLRSTMFRYRIVNAMLAIFMFTFVAVFAMRGKAEAWNLLAGQGQTMLVMLLILAMSFSSYRFVPGYIAKLRVSRDPLRWILPAMGGCEDLSGMYVQVEATLPGQRSRSVLRGGLLPVSGVLDHRVVVGSDDEWYLFRPEQIGPAEVPAMVLKPDAEVDTIQSDAYVRMQSGWFKGTPVVEEGRIPRDAVEFGPEVFVRLNQEK